MSTSLEPAVVAYSGSFFYSYQVEVVPIDMNQKICYP